MPRRRDVLERPYTVGGGSPPPPPPLDPPPLPMFEADSQIFASVLSVPRGFKLKNFRPAFGGDHRGTQGGRVSQLKPPSPPLPTLLIHPCPGVCTLGGSRTTPAVPSALFPTAQEQRKESDTETCHCIERKRIPDPQVTQCTTEIVDCLWVAWPKPQPNLVLVSGKIIVCAWRYLAVQWACIRQHPAEHDVNAFLPLYHGGPFVQILWASGYHIGLGHCWPASWCQRRQQVVFFLSNAACTFCFSLFVCKPKMLGILRRIQK